MTTGFHWKKIELVNFGDQDINRSAQFNGLTIVLTNQIYFEAIRSLLDPNYVNEKVTKRTNTEDSFVELAYEWKGREYKLKRVFGGNGRIILNGRVIKQIPEFLTRQLEAYYQTPTHLANHMVSQLFRREMGARSNLTNLLQNVRMCDECDPMTITLEKRRGIINDINKELKLHTEIDELKWKWILSKQNPRGDRTYFEEAGAIVPTNPFDDFHFRNSLVNICLAELQFDIAINQWDLFNRFIKVIESQENAYADDYSLPQSWERMLKAIAFSMKVEQHDKKLLDLYKADINIVSKYKEDFQTANAWETEKENMNMTEEAHFQDELKNEESNLKKDAEVIRGKIKDAVQTFDDIPVFDIGDMSWEVLDPLTTYIFDNVFGSLNKFSEDLCEVLNNPLLQTANISNGIAGWVHYITNNAGAVRKPRFIFDHVSSSNEECSKHLFNHLQTYLAPLSNIQFANTRDDVLEFLETNEQEENDESSATTFIFAAVDNDEPGAAPASAASRLLTNIRIKFGFEDFMNLLTNFLITCDKKSYAKKSNLLNLATKTISLSNNEKTFATESENLFQLLRAIKSIYQEIGDNLIQAKSIQDKLIYGVDRWMSRKDMYYNTESLKRSHLMNVMSLIFDECNATHQEQAIKNLKYRSTSRMTIHEQLLSLQHADGCDDSTFVETLSQRDTLDVESCEINLNEYLSTFRFRDAYKKFHDYKMYLSKIQWLQHKNDITNVHTMWQELLPDEHLVNDESAKKLSTIYNIDFALCSRYWKIYLQYREIPAPHRQRNNLSCANIFRDIDLRVSQLHYPMADPATLNTCSNILKSSETNRNNTTKMIAMIASLLSTYTNWIDETLNSFYATLTARLTVATNNAGFRVNGRFLKARYATVDRQEFAQQIHFDAEDQVDLVAIAMYVLFIQKCTESPIIINEVIEACDPITVDNVISFIETITPDRFALVHVPNPPGPNDDSIDNQIPTSQSNLHPNGNSFGPQDGAQRTVNDTAEGVETGRRMDTADRFALVHVPNPPGPNDDSIDNQIPTSQSNLHPNGNSFGPQDGAQRTVNDTAEGVETGRRMDTDGDNLESCEKCKAKGIERVTSRICVPCFEFCCESCEAVHHADRDHKVFEYEMNPFNIIFP